MARRRRNSNAKSAAEARTERLTWYFLVVVFIVYSFDEEGLIPSFVVPFAVGIILFLSGFTQYRREMKVSPLTWIGGALMIVAGGLNVYFGDQFIADPVLIALIAVISIILYGVLTNEG